MAVAGSCRGESAITLRLKDIARIEGVRDNQLTGVGLVVGLNGTGDSAKTLANIEMVVNVLERHGIKVDKDGLKVRNIAAVMLTANLPPFLRSGDRLDVQVSSFGDAKSLQGGILLQSPLTGADGQVYAVAQGAVVVSGYSAGNGRSQTTKNIPTVASVPNGALIEREVPVTMVVDGRLKLVLNRPDFTTASRLARTINDHLGARLATPVDMSLVAVTVPVESRANLVDFIAQLEALPVTPDGLAKIIISERTGTIIVGDKVRIAPVAVTHKNITVEVTTTAEVSQPMPRSAGETVVAEISEVKVTEEKGPLVELKAGATVGDIVRALNSVGTTPQDIIAILVAIHKAGALYGSLEVI
ncbi:MAG TPA: flagellar basal body P-ring protein FlgI [Firmicutes bacterium]|nr:flagellar basal body P-ring protein FlgI [Bacillota bacterium]HOQ23356.1 flagellar basal body P-ring protein FlgI [Bacillota bacterium]HPT66774.1 flagellar basal body P-ring protein FlgI [Bacillota bacterium]